MYRNVLLLLFKFSLAITLNAQQISIDRGVLASDLWCFPLSSDDSKYRYLPQEARLATGEDGLPIFSYLRYVDPQKKRGEISNTIEVSDGGGILTFVMEYGTAGKVIARAQRRLQEHYNNDEIQIVGPAIFSEATYQLVSSIITSEANEKEKVLLGRGSAPVLEGSSIPLSFNLSPVQSKLLYESFQMPIPDLSINIEMTFSGLTDAYNATLKVNWSEVDQYRKVNAGVDVYFVSADVEVEVGKLFKTQAIELTTSGEDEKTEELLNVAYEKVTTLLFEETKPKNKQKLPGSGLLEIPSGNNSAFSFLSINAGYKHRDIERGGNSVLRFDSRNSVNRNHCLVFNIGNLYKQYGDNKELFKTVNLEDPAFMSRTVQIGIDGELYPEFDKLINNVTIHLRKKHDNGEVTFREARIIGSTIEDEKMPKVSYPWKQDTSKLDWLGYDYKANYQFRGGKSFSTEWTHQNASMINLFVPYTRRNIMLLGDQKVLTKEKVRAIQVGISYPFFGETKSIQKTIQTSSFTQDTYCDITLPKGIEQFEFKLKWYLEDGRIIEKKGHWTSDILFIDEIN